MTPRWIVIHHSATDDDGYALNWKGVRDWHIRHNGWRDVGYHFGIERVQGSYEILAGRMLNEVGAHTRGLNSQSIGVVLLGNFDNYEPDPEGWKVLVRLVRSLAEVFDIPADRIIGHREVNVLVEGNLLSPKYRVHKTCPGWKFSMERLRAEVHRPVQSEALFRALNDYDRRFRGVA